MLDRVPFSRGIAPDRPHVTFGSAVSDDPTSVAQTLSLLTQAQAQAASVDTRVRILHPDWGDVRVQIDVERILVETGQAVPDPMLAGPLVWSVGPA